LISLVSLHDGAGDDEEEEYQKQIPPLISPKEYGAYCRMRV
jgi:hypothetical protein